MKNIKIKANTVKDEKKELRVVAYARVSTNKFEQKESFESQQKYYIRKINNNPNWKFVEIYSDEGLSATKSKRPGFQKLIKDGCANKYDLILVKSISRFSRNTIDTLNYVRMLREKNIEIFFEEENINTLGMDGELLLTVLGSIAQQEIINISEHVKLGHKMKMEKGEFCGTLKCYGYDYIIEEKQIVVNPEQAKVVKEIFNMYLSGLGTHKIARELSLRHIPSPTGKEYWNEGVITKIIQNSKYVGDLLLGKYYTEDPLTHKMKTNQGEKDMYLVRNHHEAIIDRETFEKAQEVKKERDKLRNHNGYSSQSRYCFSGKMKCGFCGSSLKRTKANRSKDKYSCSNCLRFIEDKCTESKAFDEAILKKAFMQSANRLRNKIKLEHRFSDKQNEVLSYARKILLNRDDIDIDKFEDDLFSKLIKFVIIGSRDGKKINPYTVRFIIKSSEELIPEEKISKEYVLSDFNRITLVDFYSNQTFQYYEGKVVKYINRFRVLVEVEF